VLAGALCAGAVMGAPAWADGQFGADSDIIGLTLRMTQEQAKTYVASKYQASPFALIPAEIIIGQYSSTAVAGFMLDASRDKPDVGNVDRVAVFFDPRVGSKDVIAITRTVQFVSQVNYEEATQRPSVVGTTVLKQVVVDSLIRKYGPPTRIVPQISPTSMELVWALTKGTAERSECLPSENSDYYYTSPYIVQSVDEEAQEKSDGFISAINNLGNKVLQNQENCGLVLNVQLDLDDFNAAGAGDNPRYVTNMREELVDLTRTSRELQQYFHEVTAAANKLDQEDRAATDTGAAPKL
jgi:hypothetical protein